jgi:hydrogenase nickel incorporation protein HypA/HybF
MHELSLTRNVVGLVAERAAGRKITQVRMRVGKLSGVEVEAVRFCFDVCAQGTTAEGARLEIEEIAGRGECERCGKSAPLDVLFGACACEPGARLRVVAGEELLLVDIQMEEK